MYDSIVLLLKCSMLNDYSLKTITLLFLYFNSIFVYNFKAIGHFHYNNLVIIETYNNLHDLVKHI